MKRIYLLRHGKSDWDASYQGDHERPLRRRGIRAARMMGRLLADADQVPDFALTSSAVRARTTTEIAAEAGEWGCPIRAEPSLYGAGPRHVLAEIQALPDDFETVLVAGHEPTFSALAGQLIGAAHVRFPTAAVARIEFPITKWSEVDWGRGTLIWFVTPRLLAAAGLEG